MEKWHALKAKSIELKRTEFANRLHEADEKLKEQFAQVEAKILEHSAKIEVAFAQLKGKNKTA